jgi:hypothetical protein
MKTNKELAQIVADRLSDRLMEDLSELIGELTMDVLGEQGIDADSDDAWETLMDVSGRIYIGAQ